VAEDLITALALDGMSSTVLGFTGCALADIGHLDRGESLLRNAVAIMPTNAQAWAALGSACLLRGQVDEAVAHLGHGIRLSPLDSRLSVWGALLALAHMLTRDLDAALQRAEWACQRDDRTYMPRLVLAAVHLARGDAARAASAMVEARRILPALTEVQITSLVGKELGAGLLRLAAEPGPA